MNPRRPPFARGAVLVALLDVALATADVKTSESYALTTLVLDGGGGRQHSANYAQDSSLAGWGPMAVSDDYRAVFGYPGQLNNPPVLTDLARIREPGTGVRLATSALIAGASDPDGDAISLVSVDGVSAEGGHVGWAGSWITYLPPLGLNGPDSFSFTIRDDWNDASTAWVVLSIARAPEAPSVNLVALVSSGGASATLHFSGVAGVSYRIDYTDSLTPPIAWTSLGSVQAAPNGMMVVLDPTAGLVPQRFYRTVLP